MRSFKLKSGVAVLLLLCFVMNATTVEAAGPAMAQQSMAQAQSALTDASLGWHRGWGWGWGPRWGGFGWGYRGWGGWGHRPWGWGGGFGYPGWGYGGYTYVRPVIYTYPAYSYPVYYTPSYGYGYTYVSPYYCASTTTSPVSYSVASYDSPAQPVSYAAASSGVSTPVVYSTSKAGRPAVVAKTFRSQYGTTLASSTANSKWASPSVSPSTRTSTVTSTLTASRLAARTSVAPLPPLPNPPTPYRAVAQRVDDSKPQKSTLHAEYLAASAEAESRYKARLMANSTQEATTSGLAETKESSNPWSIGQIDESRAPVASKFGFGLK